MKAKVREIGSGKQLFVDDYIVEGMKNVSKTLNPAKKHPDNPLIISDRPWERTVHLYGTVLYDEKKKLFRMWYGGGPTGSLYATSKDGLKWEKPNLGVVEFQGSKENNIVSSDGNSALIYSPEMRGVESSERFYKCLIHVREGGFDVGKGRTGWKPSFSPDGFHWSRHPEARLIRGSDVCDICKTYDGPPKESKAGLPKYAAFPKVGSAVGKVSWRRSVALSFSEDFVNWTEPVLVLSPDEVDDEKAEERIRKAKEAGVIDTSFPEDYRGEFYHIAVLPYEGMYLGILEVFYPCIELKRIGKLNQGGPNELQLVSSRDLIHWERVGDRKPIIPWGKRGEWDAGWQSAADSLVVIGDEMRIYYGGSNRDHGGLVWTEMPTTYGIGLATLRLDGFVSVDAGEKEGTLTTKPLIFKGNNLTINAHAKEGSVTVEILDEKGKPIRGFKRGDCDAFSGDSVRHIVTWKGNSDVSTLQGKTVKLRFHLKKAKLYAFAFQPSVC